MQQIDQLLDKIQNKKLLVIFPHPDDETVMAAGLIQHALHNNWQVKVVCVTNGTLGRINVHGQGRSMVQIRREELNQAMKALGVSDLEFWKYCDGKLKDEDTWKTQVNDSIKSYKPSLIVTYGPSGVSGHPDHLALGKYIFELQQQERLETQIIWPAFTGQTKKYLEDKVATADRLETAEFKLELSKAEINSKIEALKAHQSQDLTSPRNWVDADPAEYFATPKPSTDYNFNYVEFDLGD